MTGTFRMLGQLSLWDMFNVTSLPGSGAGLTPSNSQDGLKTDRSGQHLSHVSRGLTPDNSGEKPTNGTSGRCSTNSSRSLSLQSALASRLRQNLDVNGSPEYALTWKQWDMPSGPPICALRASARKSAAMEKVLPILSQINWENLLPTDSVSGGLKVVFTHLLTAIQQRHIFDSVSTGWPTPMVNDTTGSTHCYGKKQEGEPRPIFLKLPGAAQLAGWPTCAARDWRSESATDEFNEKRWEHPRGKPLSPIVALAGWPTPDANFTEAKKDFKYPKTSAKDPQVGLADVVTLAGWQTPTATVMQRTDHEKRAEFRKSIGRQSLAPGNLEEQAILYCPENLAGWATPCAFPANGTPKAFLERKRKSVEKTGKSMGITLTDLNMQVQAWMPGQTSTSSPVPTAKRGALAPEFSLWLMGFPKSWQQCAPHWKEWDLVQKKCAECYDNPEAFSRWLVEVALFS